MGFFPFAPQFLPLSGGTLTGVLNTAGIVNTGTISSTSTVSTSGAAAIQASGNLSSGVGSLDIAAAGQGLQVKEGSNAKQGLTAAMVAGTTTVANTSVTASSRILLTSQATGGTVGGENVSTRTAGTSFTITSTNAADTSTVGFEIFEPG